MAVTRSGTSVRAQAAAALLPAAAALLPAALFVAAGVGAWCTGSAVGVVAHWGGLLAVGVVLPGLCLVRLVRPVRASLLEDLTWAGPTGLAFTLLIWLVGQLWGTAVPSPAAGAGLALLALLVPWSRRRVLRPPEAPVGGLGPTLAIAGAGLVMVRMLTTTGLSAYRPLPTVEHPSYYPDLLFHVALTSELRRTLTPSYPMVAGEPLSYHWFYHATAAQLGLDGLQDFDVVMRLLPASLMVFLFLLAVSVGTQVAGSAGGGVAGAFLVGVAAPVTGSLWSGSTRSEPGYGGSTNLLLEYWQLSPTQTLAWVFGLASFGLVVATIRRGTSDAVAPRRLLLPFVLGAAGAKSSQNAVLLGGLVLLGAVLVAARVRGRPGSALLLRRTALVGVAVAALSLLSGALLYPRSYGVVWRPGEQAVLRVYEIAPGAVLAMGSGPGTMSTTPAAAAGAMALALIPILLPLTGVVLLLVHEHLDVAGWISVGAVCAATGALWCLRHPGQSEWYFLISAAPIALTASGAGLAVALRGLVPLLPGRRPRSAAVVAACGVAVAVVSLGIAAASGLDSPLQAWRVEFGRAPTVDEVPAAQQVAAWLRPLGLALGSALLLGSMAAWLLGRHDRGGRRRSAVGAVWLVAVLAAGAPGVAWHVAPEATSLMTRSPQDPEAAALSAQRAASTATHMTALIEAGRCVRRLAAPDDVVATNRVYSKGPAVTPIRDNREFMVSAVTGLRTDVSGYGYADRVVSSWSRTFNSYSRQPFWDQGRLQAQAALISDPTPEALAAARARGVRWVVADETSGRVSPRLSELAEPVVVRDRVHVYRIGSPGVQVRGAAADSC
jgi:hypothetical protein